MIRSQDHVPAAQRAPSRLIAPSPGGGARDGALPRRPVPGRSALLCPCQTIGTVSDSGLKLALQSPPAMPVPPAMALAVHRLPADDPSRLLRLRYELQSDPAAVRWPGPLA